QDSIQQIFSLAWEELGRAAVPFLSNWKEDINFKQASRYWYKKDPEWDILAESLDSKALFIGEAKWINKTPSSNWVYSTIEQLKYKGTPPFARQSNMQIFYGLFVPEKLKHIDLPKNVRLIEAEELLSVMK